MIYLDVLIMGQAYRLACREGEQKTLREAIAYLDGKMCALRDTGKVKGTDRIAVMAALSVAAEFLSVKSPQGPLSDMTMLEIKSKLEAMHVVLDNVLDAKETP